MTIYLLGTKTLLPICNISTIYLLCTQKIALTLYKAHNNKFLFFVCAVTLKCRCTPMRSIHPDRKGQVCELMDIEGHLAQSICLMYLLHKLCYLGCCCCQVTFCDSVFQKAQNGSDQK